jgi:hypothetical protein
MNKVKTIANKKPSSLKDKTTGQLQKRLQYLVSTKRSNAAEACHIRGRLKLK